MTKRRAHGEGSIHQRHDAPTCPPLVDGPPHPTTGNPTKVRPEHKCEGRWAATIEAGWTREGTRRRITLTARSRAEVARKINRKRRELDEYGDTGWNPRTTVKQWVEAYLELRTLPPKPLSPNGWKAAAGPLRRWVVPTIGHRRVIDLTPGDIRKVAKAQYDAVSVRGGQLSSSTVDNTHRNLMTCLRRARAEGAAITDNVFLVAKPGMGRSDRMPPTPVETLRMLEVASTLPHGLRWAFALLYGARQGELLGLVERDPLDGHACVDFDAGVIRLEWQLQELTYVDRSNKRKGFQIPRDFEAVHLTRRWHLTRPKTPAGFRELPIVDGIAEPLRLWLAERPANDWELVFPGADGLPARKAHDLEEWHAIQYTASVAAAEPTDYATPLDSPPVFHPSGQRYYHVHECRNFAATELGEVGASDAVAMGLIGHASAAMLRHYQHAQVEPKRQAVEAIAQRLGLQPG